jgi:hypothetical protein
MAYWSSGGEENLLRGHPLGDNDCREGHRHRVAYTSPNQFKAESVASPSRPFVQIEINNESTHYEQERWTRPERRKGFFVLREHDNRSSSAPPKPAAHFWNPEPVPRPAHQRPRPVKQEFDNQQTWSDHESHPVPFGVKQHQGLSGREVHVAKHERRAHSSVTRAHVKVPPPPIDDLAEAEIVESHVAAFERRFPDGRHGRMLRCLVDPKSPGADYALDDDALDKIFLAVNEIFFNGRLTKRVRWAWSNESSGPEYESRIAGHTTLRPCRDPEGGFETFITLSTPILRDPKYNRRLLISAFLHELIHCYLFICCGYEAKRHNGHTEGFKAIARTIDRWAGEGKLFLGDMEADLENFRNRPLTALQGQQQQFVAAHVEDLHSLQGHVVERTTFRQVIHFQPAAQQQHQRLLLAQPFDYCCSQAPPDEWNTSRWEGYPDNHRRTEMDYGDGSSYVY